MRRHDPYKELGEYISFILAKTKLTKSSILKNGKMGAGTYASLKKGAICISAYTFG